MSHLDTAIGAPTLAVPLLDKMMHRCAGAAEGGPGRDPVDPPAALPKSIFEECSIGAEHQSSATVTTNTDADLTPKSEWVVKSHSMPNNIDISGCRKRKAYIPRSTGDRPYISLSVPRRSHDCKAPTAAMAAALPQCDARAPASISPTGSPSARPVTSDDRRPSLAASRSRRAAKPRKAWDSSDASLSGDSWPSKSNCSTSSQGQAAGKRRSDAGDHGVLKRARIASAPAASQPDGAGAAPSEPLLLMRPKRADAKVELSFEQLLFQAFRKQPCAAYTGVVVHCQNMKVEARVNMVSYMPRRERKAQGQIYIAYMVNWHMAALVHDITASIMTAPDFAIYHNQSTKPCVNAAVASDRLNYCDDLTINTKRGCGKHCDKPDSAMDKKQRAEAELRQRYMLPPEELRKQLHHWVAHDGKWVTFRSWLENNLFVSKLATIAILPKLIDEAYLENDERCMLLSHVPAYADAAKRGLGIEHLAHTHMYEQLEMERREDAQGRLQGYKLLTKRYNRRGPVVKSGVLRWVEDKTSKREEAATEEDQQRVDVAWGVLQHWLRHHNAAEQVPRPDHDALDANYHVTFRSFAQWVNHVLATTPSTVAALRQQVEQAAGDSRTKERRGARVSQTAAIRDIEAEIAQYEQVYRKYRTIIPDGDRFPESWFEAEPRHHSCFENFFPGWKALPPSLVQPQRRPAARSSAGRLGSSPLPESLLTAAAHCQSSIEPGPSGMPSFTIPNRMSAPGGLDHPMSGSTAAGQQCRLSLHSLDHFSRTGRLPSPSAPGATISPHLDAAGHVQPGTNAASRGALHQAPLFSNTPLLPLACASVPAPGQMLPSAFHGAAAGLSCTDLQTATEHGISLFQLQLLRNSAAAQAERQNAANAYTNIMPQLNLQVVLQQLLAAQSDAFAISKTCADGVALHALQAASLQHLLPSGVPCLASSPRSSLTSADETTMLNPMLATLLGGRASAAGHVSPQGPSVAGSTGVTAAPSQLPDHITESRLTQKGSTRTISLRGYSQPGRDAA